MITLSDLGASSNWTPVTQSRFTWEQEALDFVRQRFPTQEPYRAWSNFEFIADDGSINEVDLLVFTPQGFFLIEIKSRPGRLFGDAGAWTWETDGRLRTVDNPLFAANTKAKKLRSLLERQKACGRRERLPFLDALVFCSAASLQCELKGTAECRVCLRDCEPESDRPGRWGIMAAILERSCPGLEPYLRGTHDRQMARTIGQAMEQAGVRPTQRGRKVGDFLLDEVINEGPGYQDWRATHVQLPDVKRRVRVYLVRGTASSEDRETIERAAQREFQLLESIRHPGILCTHGFTEHQLGPAIVFEHDPSAVRLDHYLAERNGALGVHVRIDLVRQIADAVRFAHEKRVVHRALCPKSILVAEADEGRPHVKIYDWQAGYRGAGTGPGGSRQVTPTSHIGRLVDDASSAYMAPEALADDALAGEHLDIFSLGAIAYQIFSGVAPAANGLELGDRLREGKGLQISAVLNGAADTLQYLIQYSTHPEVLNRIDTAVDFLAGLDAVEDELTTPADTAVQDPGAAQKGDRLAGGFTVVRRLGQGSCAVALLVERDDQQYVLKAASSPEQNARVRDEAEVLQKLRHSHIVEFCGAVEIGDRAGFLMRPVLVDRENHRIETLGHRLRSEGRLHVDLLQRFGEDLLGVVNYLEEQGLPHRDIKPDNIALGGVGRGNRLHLVLFDFSLSRTPADNIRAGTTGYLDPLLPLRKPPRWDLHAERYAAAVTLHELATGAQPRWGDGTTDPSQLETEIALDAELFDAGLRDGLTAFFRKAFRRDPGERFDNAEEMLRGWRRSFEGIEQPGALSDHEGEEELRGLLADASPATPIQELGLGTRATNALDRANVLTVGALLATPVRRLMKLRGVGNKTRREILAAVKILRERLGVPPAEEPSIPSAGEEPEPAEAGAMSVDMLLHRATRPGSREGETARRALEALLALDAEPGDPWPNQSDVSRLVGVTAARIAHLVSAFQGRWLKEPAITRLRTDVAGILESAGGVATPDELAEAILLSRGSIQEEPLRTRRAVALARVAVEAERAVAEPRFVVRREGGRVFVARDPSLAEYAGRLGDAADRLADEDPLISPARASQALRDVSRPPGAAAMPDARLVRLAVAASRRAALSSRQELYPRGMDAARALKLSQGALYGVRGLTVSQIHERVGSRYPAAAALPGRPALDDLLRDAGVDLQWDPNGKLPNAADRGCYTSRSARSLSIPSGTGSLQRTVTGSEPTGAGEVTPEIADARQFEERLQRAVRDGAFLALLVDPRRYDRARRELSTRFPIEVVDVEGLLLDALQQAADQARVEWGRVVRADAAASGADRDRLMRLVDRAMPAVEGHLLRAEATRLLIYPGLLARYDRLDLLGRLSDQVGRRGGIPGLWLLLPGDGPALIDGQAVPLLGPGQRARIPEAWLENRHRGNGGTGE